jgi:hypothetical protein
MEHFRAVCIWLGLMHTVPMLPPTSSPRWVETNADHRAVMAEEVGGRNTERMSTLVVSGSMT